MCTVLYYCHRCLNPTAVNKYIISYVFPATGNKNMVDASNSGVSVCVYACVCVVCLCMRVCFFALFSHFLTLIYIILSTQSSLQSNRKQQDKAIPLQAWTGTEGSRRFLFEYFGFSVFPCQYHSTDAPCLYVHLSVTSYHHRN
jgi:hypothetical protein